MVDEMRQVGKQDTQVKAVLVERESKAQQTLHEKVEHPVKDIKSVKWRSYTAQEKEKLWEVASRAYGISYSSKHEQEDIKTKILQ